MNCDSRRFVTAALLAVVALLVVAEASSDYYKLLGVGRDASENEIKSAFKKLARQLHPDKNKSPDAQDQFQKVRKAYDVLTDDDRRSAYDRYGEDGVDRIEKGQGGFSQSSSSVSDFFEQFRGFGGGNVRFEQEEQRGQDLQVALVITLEEVFSGADKHVHMNCHETCPHCRGSGADSPNDIQICPQCHGHRHIRTINWIRTCNLCEGKGQIIRRTCHVCKGHKVVAQPKEFDIFIPKGIKENEIIVHEHAGDEHPDVKAGHISFKVSTAAHPVFTRDGHNLGATLEISLLESLVGFDKSIIGLNGKPIKISNNAITTPGQVLTVKKNGLPKKPNSSKLGDLLVTCDVKFPETLTAEQAAVIDKVLPK